MGFGIRENPSGQQPSEKLLNFNNNQETAHSIPTKIPLPDIRHLILINVCTLRSKSLRECFKEQFDKIWQSPAPDTQSFFFTAAVPGEAVICIKRPWTGTHTTTPAPFAIMNNQKRRRMDKS